MTAERRDVAAGLRVLHVISKIGLGGAERVAESLAVGLAPRGVESTLLAVAAAPRDALAAAMRERLAEAGIPVVQGSTARSNRRAAVLASTTIARTIDRLKPDVIHVHTEVPELALAFASLQMVPTRRPSTVRTIHNSVYWAHWRLAGRFVRWALRGSRAVAVSEAAKQAYLEFSGSRAGPCDVVINGISLDGLVLRPRGPRTPPRLLFAGRLELQKGIDVLLDALALLEGRDADFDLTIVGSGRLESLVRSRLRTLSRSVALLPPSASLASEMSKYDALLMPSRFEGLGLVVAEALCVGLPILATTAPGLSEALPVGYPGLVAPGDPGALADQIVAYAAEPAPWLKRVEADRTWAQARYDERVMVDRYFDVYRSMLVEPARPSRRVPRGAR